MNFIKRGFLGITRKKAKSLILLAVIFILGNLISGAVSIQQSTGNAESSIKEKLGSSATVELDYEAIDELSESEQMDIEIQDVDIDLIKKIGELSYVKYYDYSMPTYLGSKNIESYHGEEMGEEVITHGPSMDFMLKGINYAPVLDFEEEKGELVDGRVFTEEEIDKGDSVTIISKKLAEKNNLHVGDTFTLDNEVYDFDESGEEELLESRDVVLEIIGIFEPSSINDEQDESSENGMMDMMDSEYQNTMYVPNEVVIAEENYQIEQLMQADEAFAAMLAEEEGAFEHYTPIFVLNNPEDSEAFEEEVAPLLPELYTVVSATDQYDSIAGPIESMSKLAKYVLIASVIATVLITGLVVLLFLRDRKHELGIYLSLGEKRARVVGQILIEVMVIAFIGLTISLFSGKILAEQVSDTMIKADDHESSFEEMMFVGEMQTDMTTDDVIDSYEVSLNASYIIGFYVISLITILISTVIPLVYIVRLNPKKILM